MKTIELEEATVKGSTEAERLAHLALSPYFKAALTAQSYAPSIGEQDLKALLPRLGEWSNKAANGDLRDLETMLAAQVLSLDSIFHKLAGQAKVNIGQYPKTVETYLRLALKAQNQCRTTAETLAALKSPRQHITQNNVAGAMQINIEMEGSHVDRRAEGKDAASNPAVEALGEVYGSQDPRRKSCIQQERTETRDVFS